MADVRTNAFMLSSATMMIAPAFTTDVFSLTPAAHSVGLVRDIAIPVEASQIELRNGISQVIVDSKRSNVSVSVSATIYEFSAQNLLYASALYGSGPVQVKRGLLKTAVTGGPSATSIVINPDPIPGDTNSNITAIGDIPNGSTILIARAGAESDYVFPTKTTAAATASGSDYTLTVASPYNIPTGMSFPAGSRVWILTPVQVGSIDADDLYGVKVTGTLSNFERPVTVVFPKVRMVQGFNLSFTETEYGGMPWNMQPLLLTTTEATGRLADVGTRAPGTVYVGA